MAKMYSRLFTNCIFYDILRRYDELSPKEERETRNQRTLHIK